MIPEKIIIHHSLTKDTGTVSWGAIRTYHTIELGWDDIGYHAGCELVVNGENSWYEILMGRDWFTPGAHTKNHNHDSLGFCFVGNWDEAIPVDGYLLTGAKVVKMWMELFGISIDQVWRHHDFADYKSCPGTMFPWDWFKEMIIRLMS
jgi:N-acetylmuramoyl-L-alanine amidase